MYLKIIDHKNAKGATITELIRTHYSGKTRMFGGR